ncbi:MAG: hypothetical protein NZM25_03885 [Leptospiraceae bacterium]|nr:hypothetical protein [Leptospiraceae bacterium]MDW8306126.1 hypothetical protein [Leptospiraceae bacterium]
MLAHEVADKSWEYFAKRGFPPAILFLGQNTPQKLAYIKEKIILELCRRNRNKKLEEKSCLLFAEKGEHPDLYFFPTGRVYIGNPDAPEPYTVRHLQRTFLLYPPYWSELRFVFIPEANLIQEEAESALLKSLEEPPRGTHFVLSCEEEDQLRETIISRCVVLNLVFRPDYQESPVDGWARFWFFLKYDYHDAFLVAERKGWLKKIEKFYDALNFSDHDFLILDRMLVQEFREAFAKEELGLQMQIFELSLLPLFYAIRDHLVAGPIPELAPVRLRLRDSDHAMKLYRLLRDTVYLLRQRIYGRIPRNLNMIVGYFLWHLGQLWGDSFTRNTTPMQ